MKGLITNYLLLIVIGILMSISSTYKLLLAQNLPVYMEVLELIIVLIIIFIFSIIILNLKLNFVKIIYKNASPLLLINIIFLILVLFIGKSVGGANSSLDLKFFNFQPIEFYKIALILYLAKILSKKPSYDSLKKKLFLPIFSLLLIFLEPDLGGTIIIFLLLITILILNGAYLKIIFKYLTMFFTLTLGLAYIILKFIPDKMYQIERIGAWINPFNYLDGAGGNLVQSYIAINRGGLFGTGYLQSAQNTGFLFASSTDFVFAIIAEELGIIGVILVIVLLLTFAYQIYLVGIRSNKKFEYLYCSGYASLILIQTFINVGGVTGLIPMTGVPLPFISKGINSFISLNLGFLIVLLINKQTRKEINEKKRSLHTHSIL